MNLNRISARLLIVRSVSLFLFGMLMACHASLAVQYTIKDIGRIDGAQTVGTSVNNFGHVAGIAQTDQNDYQAVYYDGTLHNLGPLFGQTFSEAWSINSSNQIAGTSYSTTGLFSNEAILYDGSVHVLGSFTGPGPGGAAYGINNLGEVTGTALNAASAQHAFTWIPSSPNGTSGTMYDIGTFGGNSKGIGINSSGEVVGYAFADQTNVSQLPFLWKPTVPNGNTGAMYSLGSYGGANGAAEAINASGQITGESNHAFLWNPTTANGVTGALVDLGSLGGSYSSGLDINSSGEVVGDSLLAGDAVDHAIVYTSASGMVDLNTLIPANSGWELDYASGVNDLGQITGQGFFGNQYHIFLLTPVPEPTSAAVALIGTASVLVGRRRRNSAPPRYGRLSRRHTKGGNSDHIERLASPHSL